ncbi:hypothetical protein BC937DRAFT_90275 [Endogone sp. FLAS-F59071]|nr:hypothetical protein BC937DRAFT_90275 [Endogone sp. FLAS-F59071]|eukprot:RUS17200.1 hypothetical protein BC937DRAFT_90275 [Endogone sp. FLAS-F59071]
MLARASDDFRFLHYLTDSVGCNTTAATEPAAATVAAIAAMQLRAGLIVLLAGLWALAVVFVFLRREILIILLRWRWRLFGQPSTASPVAQSRPHPTLSDGQWTAVKSEDPRRKKFMGKFNSEMRATSRRLT